MSNSTPIDDNKTLPKKKGRSLPPKLIIWLGMFVWTTLWRIMMSKLAPTNKSGAYIRPSSQFRNFIGTEEGNPYQRQPDVIDFMLGWVVLGRTEL